MIRLTDVQKEYENGTHALRGVTMEVNDGEFVFLVGPSGSGKSTIIKLLTGELRLPSGGRLMINGFNLNNISDRQIPLLRRSIGVIFQDFRLIEKKTVYENLSFAMRAVGSSPREAKKRIPYVLKLVGLDGKGQSVPQPALRRRAAARGHRARTRQQPLVPSSPTSRPATSTPPARWRS